MITCSNALLLRLENLSTEIVTKFIQRVLRGLYQMSPFAVAKNECNFRVEISHRLPLNYFHQNLNFLPVSAF